MKVLTYVLLAVAAFLTLCAFTARANGYDQLARRFSGATLGVLVAVSFLLAFA